MENPLRTLASGEMICLVLFEWEARRMSRKSGYRFSYKDMRKINESRADFDSI
jgi:hypothetical protein